MSREELLDMSRRTLLTWVLGVVIAGAALVAPLPECAEAAPAALLNVQPTVEGSEYVLLVSGVAPSQGAYLGRSIYPYGITDKCTQGFHTAVFVRGSFVQRFAFPISRARGGSFEVALWSKRIEPSQCTLKSDPWCKRNGFHLEGMLVYRGGWFPRVTASR